MTRPPAVMLAIVIASVFVAEDDARATDAETLALWFDRNPSQFALIADVAWLGEAAAQRDSSATQWTNAAVESPIARGDASEVLVAAEASDVVIARHEGEAGEPSRLQRTSAGLTVRRIGVDSVAGISVAPSVSRASDGAVWRGDWSIDGFAVSRLGGGQSLVLLMSYDSARTWIPVAVLPGVADLFVSDDRWWVLVGVPMYVRWRPSPRWSIEGGFIDEPTANLTFAFSDHWSMSCDARWHAEQARTRAGIDVLEELRLTAGPVWKPTEGVEVDACGGIAVDRRLVTDARIGGTGGNRSTLPASWIGGIEISVGF